MNPESRTTNPGKSAASRAPRRRYRRGVISRIGRAQRGAAAIEAVLVIPLMILIIIASVELYQYFRAAAILDRAAFTIANGIAMQRELKDRSRCSDTDDICAYGAIMRELTTPLDYSADGRIVISLYQSEQTKGSGYQWKSHPSWQRSFRGTGYSSSPKSGVSPSKGFPLPMSKPHADGSADSVVVVEVFLDYEPFVISSTFWNALSDSRELSSQAYYRPRFADLATLAK